MNLYFDFNYRVIKSRATHLLNRSCALIKTQKADTHSRISARKITQAELDIYMSISQHRHLLLQEP